MDKLKPKQVLLLGCGDIGTAIALSLQKAGTGVLAVRRNTAALPSELPALAADLADVGGLEPLRDRNFDRVLMTPVPASFDAAGYRAGFLQPVINLLELWRDGPPRRLVFVSSTRVYGEYHGEWVDEGSELRPPDPQAELMAEAESRLLESRHRVTVVRFSGIYGRQPSRLLQRIERGEVCPALPPRYSNRIHRLDCIGFLEHLLGLEQPASLYLASDNEPTLQHELELWLARQLGVGELREVPQRAMPNRRCRNQRMTDTGYRLRVPDYRAGYSAMINSTSISADLGKAAT